MPSNVSKGAEVPPRVSMLAGALSGLVTRFITAPIDVVKIRMQLHSHSDYDNLVKAVRTIYQNEGVTAFWKGNIPAEVMYLIYGATEFTSFAVMNSQCTKWQQQMGVNVPAPVQALTMGSIAGCCATAVSYPFDLLRTRLISHNKRNFMSLTGEIRTIVATNGLAGFYGGGGLSLVYTVLGTGISFSTYSTVKDHSEGTMIEPFAGLIAGFVSRTSIYPMDLLRHRLQMSIEVGAVNMAKRVFAREGLRGFYHGLLPALLKSAPATWISFHVYEWATQVLLD